MKKQPPRYRGVTLLEMMLVLVIISSIVVLGIKQYDIWKVGLDTQDIQNEMDKLFFAATMYYKAQCGPGNDLDPLTNTVNERMPLDIDKDLIKKGYLSAPFPSKANNPYVDTKSGYNGYTVQLNQYSYPRNQNMCKNPPACDKTEEVQIGTVLAWKIQVGVKMLDTSATGLSTMANLLGANCTSPISGSPGQTMKCSNNPTGNFLVFERVPTMSLSNSSAKSPYWQTIPVGEVFEQTQNPSGYSLEDLVKKSHNPEFNYYYCSS